MTNFAEKLLTLSCQNYATTQNKDYHFIPSNGNVLIQSFNAAEELQDSGYIRMLSDNLDSDILSLVEEGIISDDLVLWFEITDSGIGYFQSHLKL